MKRHVFRIDAEEEYLAAAKCYADIDPEPGGRFYDEIAATNAVRSVAGVR